VPFSPTDITGCELWCAAYKLTGLADGDPVSTFTDQSGTGDAASTGSNRPTYKTGIVNGLPVCRFDGSDDRFTMGNRVLSDFSAFFVVKSTGDGALLGGGSFFPQLRYGETANELSTEDGSNHPFSSTLGTAQGNWSYVAFLRSSGTVTFYQGGTSYGTGTLSGSQTFNLIGAFIATSNALSGDLAEVILYNSALGTTDRQSVESYLNSTYFGSPPGDTLMAQICF
jgi:hypothetical protein